MADEIKWAKASVGVISSLALAALLILDFWFVSRDLKLTSIYTLLLIIGGTLGIDMLLHNLPINIQLGDGNGGD